MPNVKLSWYISINSKRWEGERFDLFSDAEDQAMFLAQTGHISPGDRGEFELVAEDD